MTSPIASLSSGYGYGGGYVPPIFSTTYSGNPNLDTYHQTDCVNQIVKEIDLGTIFRPAIYTVPTYNPQKHFPRVTTTDVDWWDYNFKNKRNGFVCDTGNFLSNRYFDPRTTGNYYFDSNQQGLYWYQNSSSAMKCIMWYHWNEYHDRDAPFDVGGTITDFNYQQALRDILQRFPLRWYWEEGRSDVGSGNVISYFDKSLPYPFMESVTTVPENAPYTTGTPPELWYSIVRNAYFHGISASDTPRVFLESGMTFFDHLLQSDDITNNNDYDFQNPSGLSTFEKLGPPFSQVVSNEAAKIPLRWVQETIKHAQSGWDVMLQNPRTNRLHPTFPYVDNQVGSTFVYGATGISPGSVFPSFPFYSFWQLPIPSGASFDMPERYLGFMEGAIINNIFSGTNWSIPSEYLGVESQFNIPCPAMKPEISFQLLDLIHKPTGWVNDVGIPTGNALISGVPLHSGAGPFCESIHQINNVTALFYNMFGKKTCDATTYADSTPIPISSIFIPEGVTTTGNYSINFPLPPIDFVMGAVHFGSVLQPTGLRIKFSGDANATVWKGRSDGLARDKTDVYWPTGYPYYGTFSGSIYGQPYYSGVDIQWTMTPTGTFNLYVKNDTDTFTQHQHIPYFTNATGIWSGPGPFVFGFPNEFEIDMPAFQGLQYVYHQSGSNPMVDNFARTQFGVDTSGIGETRAARRKTPTIQTRPDGDSCFTDGMLFTLRSMWVPILSGVLVIHTSPLKSGSYQDLVFVGTDFLHPLYATGTLTTITSQEQYVETSRSITQADPLTMAATLNINDVDVPLSDFGGGYSPPDHLVFIDLRNYGIDQYNAGVGGEISGYAGIYSIFGGYVGAGGGGGFSELKYV